jgi:hypothetical protein
VIKKYRVSIIRVWIIEESRREIVNEFQLSTPCLTNATLQYNQPQRGQQTHHNHRATPAYHPDPVINLQLVHLI